MKELQEFIDEQAQVVEGIRQKWEEVEKGVFTKAEAKEYEEKANIRFDELGKEIKKLTKLNERLDEIETKMNRPGNAPENKDKKSPEHKAFEKFLRFGERELTSEEFKLLRPSEGKVLTIGGGTGVSYLAPGEYVNEIIKGVTEISPSRSLADVKPTSTDYSEIPKRTGQFAAAWVSEIGNRSETTGLTYGLERIPNHEMYADVRISKRALEDSAFNLEAELTAEFAEQFAKAEGTAFVTGNGVGKPEGFTVNTDVHKTTVVFDASDDAIVLTGLIDLLYAIKTAYARNATIVARRATIAYLRKMKDANNKYYWEPDWQLGTPGRFMGNPIVEVPDMAACADGALSIGYGDFKKGYVISDRVQIEIQRLVELYAASGQVGFLARKRVGGQVVLPEAIYLGVGQA
jgi:HK97 family phage major capsid protein